ncbi:MAG: biotin/lipoyl-containing protein [Verrucomicrobiota bacterium]
MKKLRITVEGKAYDVTVEVLEEGQTSHSRAQRPRPAASVSAAPAVPAPQPQTPAAAADGSVVSPLAGKIVSIEVSSGQAVKEGDELITMEAMKMNTHVFAPADGTIGKILVGEGDAVEEGQPLIEMT